MKSTTKRTMIIGGGLAVILIVGGAIFAGCSDNNETSGTPKASTSVQSSKTPTQQSQNQPQAQKSQSQNAQTKSANTPSQTQSGVSSQGADSDLEKRQATDTGVNGEYQGAAVLTNKYSILYAKQYQYIFELRLSNNNGSKTVNYYTTKNVFDTANVGDTYKVTYGGDSEGNIAIRTISQ